MEGAKVIGIFLAAVAALTVIIYVPLSLYRQYIAIPMGSEHAAVTGSLFIDKVHEHIGSNNITFENKDIAAATKCDSPLFRLHENKPRCTFSLRATGRATDNKQALIDGYQRLTDYYKQKGWRGSEQGINTVYTDTDVKPIGFRVTLRENGPLKNFFVQHKNRYEKDCSINLETPQILPHDSIMSDEDAHQASLYCAW